MAALKLQKELFVRTRLASTFCCLNCKLICGDIRELSCTKGHLCCESCWTQISSKQQCPICVETVTECKRTRFVENQQSALRLRCPNSKCLWTGTFGVLSAHLRLECEFRMEKCPHCSKSFVHKQFQIHRETCDYLLVSCPLSCDKERRWLRKKISHHLKMECPHYVIKCDYVRMGCKFKSQRCQMQHHLQFECQYRMVQCPFIQYGCTQTVKMHYHEMTQHLQENEVKHLTLKLVHLSDHVKSIEKKMNQRLNEQSKQIEFLQRKVQFQGNQSNPQCSNYRNRKSNEYGVGHNLSNDCHGLLFFCGSVNGGDITQNGVEWIDLKTKTKHSLCSKLVLEDVNRIYHHQYIHLSGARNSIDFSSMEQILDDVQSEYRSEEDEKQNKNDNDSSTIPTTTTNENGLKTVDGSHGTLNKNKDYSESTESSQSTLRISKQPIMRRKHNENHNSWDIEGNGLCTGYNIPFSYIQPYLVNSSFGSNTSGIDSIFSFDDASFWETEKVTMVFRCGGAMSRSKQKLSRVDGCVLETGDWFQLPYCNKVG